MDPLENNLDDLLVDNLTNSDNSTSELDQMHSDFYQFSVAMELTSWICGFGGIVADVIILWILIRNAKMRNRTNVLIMQFAICDLLFLLCSTSMAVFLLNAIKFERYHLFTCIVEYFDITLHFNTSLVMIALSSNTIFKNERIKTSYIVIALYAINAFALIIHTITCCTLRSRFLLFFPCFILFLLNVAVLLVKEVNSCYKTYKVHDPLCPQTRFRLNLCRIFVYNYLFSFLYAGFVDIFFWRMYYFYLLVNSCFLTSLYMLIFLVINDRHYNECFFKMLKCQSGNISADGLDDLSEIGNENSTPPFEVLREQLEQK